MKLKVFQIECEFEPGESADVLKQVAALLFGQFEPTRPAPAARRLDQPTGDTPAAPVVETSRRAMPLLPVGEGGRRPDEGLPALEAADGERPTNADHHPCPLPKGEGTEQKPPPSSWQAVLEDLKTHGPCKPKAIAARLDRAPSLIATQLCQMKKRNLVVNDQSARWHAMTPELETLERRCDGAIHWNPPDDDDDDGDEPDVVGREDLTHPTAVEHPIPTKPAGKCEPEHAGSPMSLFINELSTPTREVVRLTRSDTPRELAEYGRREFLCRMGAKSHHADEVERWLRGRFKLNFAG